MILLGVSANLPLGGRFRKGVKLETRYLTCYNRGSAIPKRETSKAHVSFFVEPHLYFSRFEISQISVKK
jgi:hypothetical protein